MVGLIYRIIGKIIYESQICESCTFQKLTRDGKLPRFACMRAWAAESNTANNEFRKACV